MLAGGVGTIGGTIVGAFVIGVLNDSMIMVGVSDQYASLLPFSFRGDDIL